MKYHVTVKTSGTMVFEIDSNLVDTGVFPFEIWAKDNAEQICKYYNPIKDKVHQDTIEIEPFPSCSKQEAYEILAEDLSYKKDGTALGRDLRLKYLEILKPEE